MKRPFFLAFAFLLLLGLVFSQKWIFKKHFGRRISSFVENTQEPERLRNVLHCAINEHLDSEFKDQSKRIIDLIYRELANKFVVYGVTQDLEKMHFLAQAMKETGNFLFMVEKANYSTWREVFRRDSFPEGNCQKYLEAIESDKNYFDKINDENQEHFYPYRADFRGRGLFQITHCVNYLGFFYHKAAERIDRSEARLMRTYFQDSEETPLTLATFCDQNILRDISLNEFERIGLPPLSNDVVYNFENTVNQLSLPCHGKEKLFIQRNYQCPNDELLACSNDNNFRAMDNLEFLVDSALWYWKKCRRIFPNELKVSSNTAVAAVSFCIHGAKEYLKFVGKSCDSSNSELNSRRFRSYCDRLKNFRILENCFERHLGS